MYFQGKKCCSGWGVSPYKSILWEKKTINTILKIGIWGEIKRENTYNVCTFHLVNDLPNCFYVKTLFDDHSKFHYVTPLFFHLQIDCYKVILCWPKRDSFWLQIEIIPVLLKQLLFLADCIEMRSSLCLYCLTLNSSSWVECFNLLTLPPTQMTLATRSPFFTATALWRLNPPSSPQNSAGIRWLSFQVDFSAS